MQIPENAKILVIDIETSPMIVYTFALKTDYIGVDQIIEYPHIMSITAKWAGQDEILYKDQSKCPDPKNDMELTCWARELMDQADIVVGQNSKSFDTKYIQARIEKHELKRPSDYRHQDTKIIAKRMFKLPSYSLKSMCEYFNLKYKKTEHKKFPGINLWKECMAGNPEAWEEMREYNKFDVLATEELWMRLVKWDDQVTYHSMTEDAMPKCDCGSLDLRKNGYRFKNGGKFQRYACFECGKPVIAKENLLSKIKKSEMPR